MHVALRRREVLMSREFLNRPCRRPLHRQVRTEAVAQHVLRADSTSRSDSRAIFTAASHAQRTADFINGLQPAFAG